MTGLVVRIVVIFAILSLVYIGLSAIMRWDRRKGLEAEFDSEPVHNDDRETYVAQGMRQYDGSLRKKLLLSIFGLPALVIGTLIFVAYMD